jgi:hypothetical protein
MPGFYILEMIGYSVGIAAIIGMIRFKKILKSYQPFIYITCAGLLSEILAMASSILFRNNTYVLNLYGLAEALLFAWLFHRWGAFGARKWYYPAICFLLIILWASDILFWHRFTTILSFFNICYAFLLVFLSIDQVNKLIVQERGNILRNSKFLVCGGVIIFFSYNAIIQVFFLLHLKASTSFYQYIYLVMIFVNFIVNLVYALATLWIPTKQKFILLS